MRMTVATVTDALHAEIRGGQLAPGARVPSVRELARRFGVAHATAAKAMRILADEGLIESQPGRGSFVTDFRAARQPLGRPIILLAMLHDGDIDSPHHDMTRVFYGVQEEAAVRGYEARISLWDHAGDLAEFQIPNLAAIVAGNYELLSHRAAEALHRRVPVVYAGYGQHVRAANEVRIDHEEAGRLAAEHLIAAGHRRLAFVTTVDAHQEMYRLRFSGIASVMAAAGHPAPVLMSWHVRDRPEAVTNVLRAIALGEAELPTGLVVASDPMASEILTTAAALGLDCPAELSVVGFGDYADTATEGLTTVHYELQALGRSAVVLADAVLRSSGLAPLRLVAPVRLVTRGSVVAPRVDA
ncbi:MAG: GntR family transcriptional regulator [Planctomycetota bacterium]|jgi:DNA-binding LacI/PurR family transcriptional regulator|nr:GntR family transcriptional regulator [Planctomycetota bacterium]